MKHADDNHIYQYIFIAKLKKNINDEVLRLSKFLKIKNMKFNEVFELTKCAKQIVNLQFKLKNVDNDSKIKTRNNNIVKRINNDNNFYDSLAAGFGLAHLPFHGKWRWYGGPCHTVQNLLT